MPEAKKETISRLQQDILRWQGFALPATGGAKRIGLGPLEDAFPNGVFPTGTIHEMLCPTQEQAAATSGLLSGLLAILMRQGGVCIWISTGHRLFPAAMEGFEVAADRLVFIDVPREKDILWAMEEALKCEGLAAVVVEVSEISFAQSQRLQLVVERSKVTGFVMRNNLKKLSTSLCAARWQIVPLPSKLKDGLPGVGYPRWQVDLLKVRNGNPGSWQLEWTADGFTSLGETVTEIITTRQVG